MIPLLAGVKLGGLALRAAPVLLLAAAVAYGVHRIRADAAAAVEQAATLRSEQARADGLALAVTTLRGHYERAAAASARHRHTVNELRATLDADQAALSRLSDACLDAPVPADLRQRLRGDARPAGDGADPAADAGGAARPPAAGL